jgi:hypothetical protein
VNNTASARTLPIEFIQSLRGWPWFQNRTRRQFPLLTEVHREPNIKKEDKKDGSGVAFEQLQLPQFLN